MYKPNKAKFFGAAIKQLLSEKNLSQRQFAKKASLEPAYVSKLVKGLIAEPRQDNRRKIANGLEITEQELLEQIAQYTECDNEALSANLGYSDQKPVVDSVAFVTAPVMSLQFADCETRQELGNSIELSSIAYVEPVTPLPDTKAMYWQDIGMSSLKIGTPNPSVCADYWREKEEYIRLTNLLKPVAFVIHNQSSILAQGVRVEIIGSFSSDITVTDRLPNEPVYDYVELIPLINTYNYRLSLQRGEPQTEVVYHGSQWTLTVHFGNVQPKSCVWADEPFYIGSSAKESLELEAVIYADNLPDPQKVKLTIEFEVENRFPLTIDELRTMPPFKE